MSKKEKYRKKAVEFIKENPNGIRYSDLKRKLQDYFQDFTGTVRGSIWDLDKKNNYIEKPERGLFKYRLPIEEESKIEEKIVQEEQELSKKINETDLYEPFANWLVDEDQATVAVKFGGSKFGYKWGTPDVIGTYKYENSILKSETEIITAEIKTDPSQLITAFGQAIAYKLFSSKVFLVIPSNIRDGDLGRITSLCELFGVGLILCDLNKISFERRVSARKQLPDMFYADNFAKKLLEIDKKIANKLFAQEL